MNRHLHNTLTALAASGSLLVLGLIAAAPLVPQGDTVAPQTRLTATGAEQAAPAVATNVLVSAVEAAAVAMLADAIEQPATTDSATTRTPTSSQRARRQTLVMPYLSFLPRS